MYSEVDVLPVVEAGSSHFFLREVESQRLDKVEPSPEAKASAANVPRVGRDKRSEENDVQCLLKLPHTSHGITTKDSRELGV